MKYRWLIFFSLLGGLLWYTIIQAESLWPSHPALAALFTVILFIFMFSWQFLARAGASRLDSRAFRLFAWVGSFLLGAWATVIVIWAPIDLGRDLYFAVHKYFVSGHLDILHFLHQGQWVLAGVVMLSCGLAGLGLEEALSGPHVVEVNIPVPDLPSELDGLRIVQVTDLHVGPMIRHGYVEEMVRQVMALKPDLIAVTGDLADGTVDVLSSQVEPLSALKAPLGVYFVTGNHEYYWGVNAWLKKVRELGFTTLLNENRVVSINGTRILVAGVTDLEANHFTPEHLSDPKKAIASDQSTAFKLLLAHRPTSCFEAEPLGFNLQLSGHTHGGQFFPFSEFIRFFYKYYRGLNRHKRMWVYVNPGTGYWGPPHRFLVPAEVTLLRLTADASKATA
jgi:predicted MPP superfamily phosphohydrolase